MAVPDSEAEDRADRTTPQEGPHNGRVGVLLERRGLDELDDLIPGTRQPAQGHQGPILLRIEHGQVSREHQLVSIDLHLEAAEAGRLLRDLPLERIREGFESCVA